LLQIGLTDHIIGVVQFYTLLATKKLSTYSQQSFPSPLEFTHIRPT